MKQLNEDERLAAFLDGRLDPREREAMLARLTADDDAYEVFAHTAEVLRLVEADAAGEDEVVIFPPKRAAALAAVVEPGGAGVPEDDGGAVTLPVAASANARGAPEPDAEPGVTRLHPRKPATAVRWLALAAGIAGLALAGRALWPGASYAGEPVRLAARLAHAERGLPAKWNDDNPWAAVRGDGATDSASTQEQVARAADAGALLLDLSVAVQAGDSVETSLLATQIAELYDLRTTGPGGALRKIINGAGSSPGRLRPLVEQATDQVAQRLEQPEVLRLGAWIEAARLAARTRDAAFFEEARTQRMLDDAARLTASDRRARAAVEQVRGLLPGAGPPRWEALASALYVLVGEIVSA